MKQLKLKKPSFSIDKWFANNGLYLLSFVLPVLSIIVVYIFKGVFPFGDEMYLRSDCYHQYAPFLAILQEKFKEGGSLLFTWEIGGGMNFIALAAYYLASPLNILALIWPSHMADFVGFFIVIKMGLSGFAVSYYLSKHFKKYDISIVVFGMAYALSAYFAAFSWNIMWLDCMWLLPFIILGLERLVNEGRCKMYCISLALAIFSNYYIGIMLCIFSVIYFVYLVCVSDFDEPLGAIKGRLIAFKDFALYSLLSGGMAAVMVLPAYFALLTTKSASSTFPANFEEYFSVLYSLFRSLMCIPVADLKYPHDPNIYCSVAIFVLIPLFWLGKNIDIRKRVGKTILAVIMLLSFNLNIPNYIWHGFHFPNSLPCRESFIYVFLVITMAYEAFVHLKEYKTKHILGSFGGAIAFILILQELFPDAAFFSDMVIVTSMMRIVYYSAFFIALYVILMFAYRKREDMTSFVAYLMVLVVFVELTINMSVTGIVSTSNRDGYYESLSAYQELEATADEMADKDSINFYRSETKKHTTRNDGARFGYNSMSTFCSVSSEAMQDYLKAIGMQTSFNAYSYLGHTPVTASMFSVLYEYSSAESSMPNQASSVSSASYTTAGNATQNINLYRFNNTLPLGFMINTSTMANWNRLSGDPFDVQNGFLTNAVNGGKKVWNKLVTNGTGSIVASYESGDNSSEEKMDVYFYCVTSAESITATVSGSSSNSYSFDSTQQNYICHVGDVSPGDTITLAAGDGQALSTLYAYAFDSQAWDYDYELLKAHSYQVTEFKDTKITGTVNVDATGIMYTSIPYDKGWAVYIDGKKSKTTPICDDALTGVLLDPGEHTITFKYSPQGFVPGIFISIICIAIFVLLSIFKEQINEFFNKITKTKSVEQ